MSVRRRLTLLALTLAGIVLVVVALWPFAQDSLAARRRGALMLQEPGVAHRLHAAALLAIMGGWFFALGAAMGSFLNVVAWRMPRGVSLVKRGSHCPYCDTPIPASDNVPVLGWLWLGGRCRTCRLPIAPRYVLVELTAGFVFLTLAVAELLLAGRNLPSRTANPYLGSGWTNWLLQWDLIRVYIYHCTLISVLLTCALIKIDRTALPWKLIAFALLVGFGLPAVWPDVHPVPWTMERPAWLEAVPGINRVDSSLVGLAAGAALGAVLSLAQRGATGARGGRLDTAIVLALPGLYLGWQAALSIAALSGACVMLDELVCRIFRRPVSLPPVVWIGLATFGQILLWRALTTTAWWPPNLWS
jgi:leader peptidase (prepilin peptidase) / N-methyltransferase